MNNNITDEQIVQNIIYALNTSKNIDMCIN